MSIRPLKSLGQHFLTSRKVLLEIIDAAKIEEGEYILEIGPGEGMLTAELLAKGAIVLAVEKDGRSYGLLESKFQSEIIAGKLTLINGDILDQKIFEAGNESVTIAGNKENITHINDGPFALVANIPYYITGAILEKFLEAGPRPSRAVLLVQKEVAERIIARDNKESLLSISVKAFAEPRLVSIVPPGAFNPPPSVYSAILSLDNINAKNFSASGVDVKNFFTIVKAGFSHKRKFLKRNLEDVLEREQIDSIWNKLQLDPKVRAEDLSCEDWLKISREE